MEDRYTIKAATLIEIADAIRAKTGRTDPIAVEDFASVVEGIEVGIVPSGTLEITANGTYDVTDKANVTVAVEADDSALPIEVSTEAEMTELLETAEVGSVYKYVGETTDTCENGALYLLEVGE